MDTYVIMKKSISPIYICEPEPCFVCFSKEESKNVCKNLSAKAKNNIFWIKKCKNNISNTLK